MSDAFEIDVRGMLERRIADAPAAHAWSDVERRAADPERPAPPQGRRSTPMVWLAIAAAAILAVAGTVSFLRDDNGSVVTDDGPTTTVTERPDTTTVDEEGLGEDEPTIDDEATPPGDEQAAPSGGFAPIEPGTWHVAATASDQTITPDELDRISAQINEWPGVVDMETAIDAAAWERLTGLSSGLCDGDRVGPPCGPGVVLLLVEGQQQAIGRRLESELEMVPWPAATSPVEFIQAYFAAAVERASPAPIRFDPSSLGDEVKLTGPSSDPGEHGPCRLPGCEILDLVAVGLDVDGEDVGVSLAVVEHESGLDLVLEFGGTGFIDPAVLLPGSGGRAGVAGWRLPRFGADVVTASRSAVFLAGLPLEVAIVTMELADGSTVWQRPLGGLAVLPGALGSADGFDVDSVTTVTALDGDGNEMLLIDVDGVPPDRTLVTDLRVDPDRLAAAEAALAQVVAGSPVAVDAGDLTVTWAEAIWGPDAGPEPSRLEGAVATTSGVLAVGPESGVVWRWSDGQRWDQVTELSLYEVAWLVDGDGRVIANARRRDGREWAVLSSLDGSSWVEIDTSAVPDESPLVTATSASGLSIIGSDHEAGLVAVIDGDRIVEVYDPPWALPSDDSDETLGANYFEILDDVGGGPVVVRYVIYWDGDDETISEAWRYLGDGEFAPPTQIPLSWRSARVGDTILRFDRTGYEPGDQGEITGEISDAPLFTTENGTEWTLHSTPTADTTSGLAMHAGDFFWVYGLSTNLMLQRRGPFATLWISTDAETWSPLDVSMFPDWTMFKIVGDTIFAFEWAGNPGYWVGTVEPA